ncbi:group-specific protein [Paenibacillus larvae subsp. pulvifaciens]|uniref:group-specific protein n=1 Tax=Paenibacillus larvae TaxID=1464 RepID=UPI00098F7919|nr:group-specific protein [Paenibacillus larvae]AQT86874.1 group-specific protein [Paenibacillus larvae subsp. pulvifaciens]MBH0342134.1 group-specific protein [Paenibacillus larvae]MCY7520477.1 group-specific protein [Paenibacillus larvae]MCY9501863.1 group-specific protein [Paenibacillus larvae]MCY9511358.1 group-specific protein [Paenibacillus larvae]
MIQVQVDEEEIKQLYMEAISSYLDKLNKELVYWDSSELKRRTCMSWNKIVDSFFHHPDFSKVKVGGKWYFPAKETEEFLLAWLSNNPSKS